LSVSQFFFPSDFYFLLQVKIKNEIEHSYDPMDELILGFAKQSIGATTLVLQKILFSIKIQSFRDDDQMLLSKLEPHQNKDFEHFHMLLPMPGSVYILCTGNSVPNITQFEIEGFTFFCESIDVINEIDREDSNGDILGVLCKSNDNGSIKVEPHVEAVALKYLKKTCSGTNKKNLPCGNRVCESLSRCRWHIF
jgi:hypothetical protein